MPKATNFFAAAHRVVPQMIFKTAEAITGGTFKYLRGNVYLSQVFDVTWHHDAPPDALLLISHHQKKIL